MADFDKIFRQSSDQPCGDDLVKFGRDQLYFSRNRQNNFSFTRSKSQVKTRAYKPVTKSNLYMKHFRINRIRYTNCKHCCELIIRPIFIHICYVQVSIPISFFFLFKVLSCFLFSVLYVVILFYSRYIVVNCACCKVVKCSKDGRLQLHNVYNTKLNNQ